MAVDSTSYDFIVIGGGTAGNVVAGRLATNPNVRIVIVEAGEGDPKQVKDITTPALAFGLRGSKYDWSYDFTVVKRDDYERTDKPHTRGKILGGSSCGNYYTWVPGSKATFDMWGDYGGQGWTWEHLVPYLRKSATYHDDTNSYPAEFKKLGPGGPIHIAHTEMLEEMTPFHEALKTAWKSKGEPLTDNIYDGEMSGLTHCIASIYKGQRSGSYLFVENKPNITIFKGCQSKRLIIDAADKTCKGVTVCDAKGNEHNLFATREVVLSQGVFETPKLLMLSGIGPSKALRKHDLDVLVDSPHVGQNLLDHPAVPFVLRVKDGYSMDNFLLHEGSLRDQTTRSYDQEHRGPLGSGLLEMVGFPRIDSYLEKDETYRKAKAANGNVDPMCPGGQPHFELDFVGMYGSAFQWHRPVPDEGCYTTVVVDLVRPMSKPGEVTLSSADPLAHPNIAENFFGDELDIIAMREGIRFTYDLLMKGDGFKDIVIAEHPNHMPLEDDEKMKQAILDRCQTAFHPCGTARLSKSVEQGVVDPVLRVHGIRNLRVIDGSVIPVIPDCRIQNSVYMIGEKGADMIKTAHKDLYSSEMGAGKSEKKTQRTSHL